MQTDETATSCGLFTWRPRWLQIFARKEAYVLVYSLIGIIQGMGGSYLTAVLSTIEKQFGIKSKETAWVFSGNEISQILFIFALPFLGLIKKRTLWTSLSMILTALGFFLCALPFFVRSKSSYEGGWTGHRASLEFCTNNTTSSAQEKDEFCQNYRVRDPGGMTMIFFGFFVSGIGSSFFHSFGIPYIDDNTSKNQSPIILGLIYGSRTLGPGLGSILGGFCLRQYVYPGLQGELIEGDEGWLGAWWLGFVIVGALTAIIAPLLAFFPQRLASTGEMTDAKYLVSNYDFLSYIESRTYSEKENKITKEKTGSEYFLETKKCTLRLLRNKIYMWNLFSVIVAVLSFSGMGTFFPKYLEYHFRQKASKSGFSALSGPIGTGIGISLSGYLISKYKFKAKTLAGWSIFSGVIGVFAVVLFGFLACPKLNIYGLDGEGGQCSVMCGCEGADFNPTCSMDGQTLFYSPCNAGCRTRRKEIVKEVETYIYEDCSCVSEAAKTLNRSVNTNWWLEKSLPSPVTSQNTLMLSEAVEGFCPSESCDEMFYITMVFIGFVALLASTSRVGNSIINLRAVDPQDKAASLTILISALSLFAFFPSPLVYGALMDSTCIVWGERCGELTNCQLYDTDMMRYLMSGATAVGMVLSLIGDIMVWRHVGDLELYQDDGDTADKDLAE